MKVLLQSAACRDTTGTEKVQFESGINIKVQRFLNKVGGCVVRSA